MTEAEEKIARNMYENLDYSPADIAKPLERDKSTITRLLFVRKEKKKERRKGVVSTGRLLDAASVLRGPDLRRWPAPTGATCGLKRLFPNAPSKTSEARLCLLADLAQGHARPGAMGVSTIGAALCFCGRACGGAARGQKGGRREAPRAARQAGGRLPRPQGA